MENRKTKAMIEVINKRIEEIREWIEGAQNYLDNNDNLTKKERNHYLNEMIIQSNIVKELELIINLSKLK